MTISYRRTFQGAWALSAIVGDHYLERQYFGYTKQDATRRFQEEVKGL